MEKNKLTSSVVVEGSVDGDGEKHHNKKGGVIGGCLDNPVFTLSNADAEYGIITQDSLLGRKKSQQDDEEAVVALRDDYGAANNSATTNSNSNNHAHRPDTNHAHHDNDAKRGDGVSLSSPKELHHVIGSGRNSSSGRGGSLSGESAQERLARIASMSSNESSVMSFHDIHYTVKTKVNPCSRAVPKQILMDINGIFKPGMNAVMGPTGSGKSSLLDILAGRKDPGGLKGTVLIDGLPPPENFKVLVGYVSQDDCVTDLLTIRENFAFSAALRLPKTINKEERKARVDQVIKELGLTAVADSKVGNEFIRGISGGERKRCNIGMELIISPPVLFLDEPTTGLDANTANSVMMLLKKLSSGGRNIIFSIHQPRYSIYRLFDSLMLLSLGHVVYHGPSPESLTYFTSIGFECDRFNNPADFFLDVINGDTAAITSLDQLKTDNGGPPAVTGNGEARVDMEENQITVEGHHQEYLVQKYKESSWHSKLQEEINPIIETYRKDMDAGVVFKLRTVDYKTSFLDQFVTVSGRAIRNLLRNPQIYIMQFVVISIFAMIVGAVYYQLNDSRTSAIQNRVGAFFFIVMNQVFGNMSAVEIFIKERAIFIHENTSGFYRVSAYFLAKVLCDLIPMRMVPAIIFSLVAYFMIGLADGVVHFVIFALTIFLTALAASGLSFFISSSVRIFSIANLCLALCYVFMMLFSGLLVNVGDILSWLSWIKYLSIFRYSLNALDINELKDRAFCGNGTNSDGPPPCPVFNISCTYGNDYLAAQGIDYKTDWDLWKNNMALGIMVVGFLFLSYVQLRRMKKLN